MDSINVCYAWMQNGFCSRGSNCRFLHPQQHQQQYQQQQQPHAPQGQRQGPQHALQQQQAVTSYDQGYYQGHGRWEREPTWPVQQQHPPQQHPPDRRATGPMLGLHRPAPQHSMPMQEPAQQYFDSATMQQPMQQQMMPAQPGPPRMYPEDMQQPMQPSMQQSYVDPMQQQQWQQDFVQPRHQHQHQHEQQNFMGGPSFGSGPPFRGSGPPGGAGSRGAQEVRGPPNFRQELPPEPTEPAYKTRVWHKSLEESVSTPPSCAITLLLLYSSCACAFLHVVLTLLLCAGAPKRHESQDHVLQPAGR